jgi:hypothetical protein
MKYLVIALLLLAAPAFAEIVKDSSIKTPLAEQHTAITDELVRKYYDDQIANLKVPYDDYIEYVNKSYNDKFVSKHTTTVAVQGQPEQVQQIDKGKADLLNMDRATQGIARTAKVTFTIDKIDIDAQNNTARVAGHSALEITIPRDDGLQVAASTTSDCTDTLVLEQGRLQMLQSVCTARTELKPKSE